MTTVKNLTNTFFIIMVLGIGCIAFLACGSNEESGKTSSKKKSPTAAQASSAPSGWKTFQFQGWNLSFPGNWHGDADAGIWWPGQGSINMGRPALSVHSGGIPIMPNTTFEDRVKRHLNGEAKERKNVTIAGYSGFQCAWENMGKKHIGLFLEEKVGGGIGVIHFIDCQAPIKEFGQHQKEFEQIIAQFKK